MKPDRPGKVVTFGEVMMRLSPPGRLRLGQARALEVTFGGSEANVAAALAQWGVPVEHVTALPENDLGRACARFLRQFGVGLEHVVWGGGRLGLYFYERGAAHRPDTVLSTTAPTPPSPRWNRGGFPGRTSSPTPPGSTGAASLRPSPRRPLRPAGRRYGRRWRWGSPSPAT